MIIRYLDPQGNALKLATLPEGPGTFVAGIISSVIGVSLLIMTYLPTLWAIEYSRNRQRGAVLSVGAGAYLPTTTTERPKRKHLKELVFREH